MEAYDSGPDTQTHIRQVQRCMDRALTDLIRRRNGHDRSKLQHPEKPAFDAIGDRLGKSTYGSEEYKSFLAELQPTLAHHYAHNAGHHPEGNPRGIQGMNLMGLLEMVCDWKAASLRHADGDIMRSIEINQERFGYSDELKAIFINTVQAIGGGAAEEGASN